MVGVVIGDAVSNDVVSDVERGGDGGGASHIGDNRLAGEEAGDGEAGGAKRKASFSSLFVKLGPQMHAFVESHVPVYATGSALVCLRTLSCFLVQFFAFICEVVLPLSQAMTPVCAK